MSRPVSRRHHRLHSMMGSPGHSSSSALDSWALTSAHFPASDRDADAITRALRASISGSSPLFLPLSSTAADPASRPSSRPGATGRVSKRKSRATKRSATTFIAADPANFREMVQQVTGVGVDAGQADLAAVGAQLSRDGGGGYEENYRYFALPSTLDTSAFFLEQEVQLQEHQVVGLEGFGPRGEAAAQQAQLQSFPTLESWKVI